LEGELATNAIGASRDNYKSMYSEKGKEEEEERRWEKKREEKGPAQASVLRYLPSLEGNKRFTTAR